MKDIFSFIKSNFERPENGLTQIVLTHVIIAVVILLLKVGLLLTSSAESIAYMLNKYLYLSSYWKDLLYKPWTLITYFFVTDKILPLIVNLYLLYVFGGIISSLLGSKRLLNLYFLGGITGGLVFVGVYTFAPLLAGAPMVTIYLPAAVYAVIAGAATFSPNLLFNHMLMPVQIKYIAFLILLQPLVQLTQGNIVAVTQLGSAFAGYVYIHYLKYLSTRPDLHGKIKRLFSRRKSTHENTTLGGKGGDTNASPKQIQAIFDKIASKGYNKLTQEEKERLLEESER